MTRTLRLLFLKPLLVCIIFSQVVFANNAADFDKANGMVWASTKVSVRNLNEKLKPSVGIRKHAVAQSDSLLASMIVLYITGIIGNPGYQFKIEGILTDKVGDKHITLQQKYNNVNVLTGRLTVHADSSGAIWAITGMIAPALNISTVPNVSPKDVGRLISANLGDTVSVQSLELLVAGGRLCYKLHIPQLLLDVFIDADSGEILSKESSIRMQINQPPIPDFGATRPVSFGGDIVLDATRSRDPDGVIDRYQWNRWDGPTGTWQLIYVGPNSTFTTNSAELHGFEQYVLSVRDDDGQWAQTADAILIAVHNPLPNGYPADGEYAEIRGSILVNEGGQDVASSLPAPYALMGWHNTVTNTYYMSNPNANLCVADGLGGPVISRTADNDWTITNRHAMSIARNIDLSMNYCNNVLGLASYDDIGNHQGNHIEMVVGDDRAGARNAFWAYPERTVSVGSSDYGCLDVIGHEFGHAITQFHSNLDYVAQESGALNEAYGDITGTLIEFNFQTDDRANYPAINHGRADWYHAEDNRAVGSGRNLRDPQQSSLPSLYRGSFWYTGADVNNFTHTNMGVGMFAFYLLSDGVAAATINDDMAPTHYQHAYGPIQGLGYAPAGQIVMNANINRLITEHSDYRDARIEWIRSAKRQRLDANTVAEVWAAVGVIDRTVGRPATTPSLPSNPPDYASIQDALAAANDGDLVYVYNASLTSDITVNTNRLSLVIRGTINLNNHSIIVTPTPDIENQGQIVVSEGSTPATGSGLVLLRTPTNTGSVGSALYPTIEEAVNQAQDYEKIEVYRSTYTITSPGEINPKDIYVPGGIPEHQPNPGYVPGGGLQNVQMVIHTGTIINFAQNFARGIYLNSTGKIQLQNNVTLNPSVQLIGAPKAVGITNPVLGFFATIGGAADASPPGNTILLDAIGSRAPYNAVSFHLEEESLIGVLGNSRQTSTIIQVGHETQLPVIFPNQAGILMQNLQFEVNAPEADPNLRVFRFYTTSGTTNSEFKNVTFVNTSVTKPKALRALEVEYQIGSLKLTNCLFKNFIVGVDILSPTDEQNAPLIDATIFDANATGAQCPTGASSLKKIGNCNFWKNDCDLKIGSTCYNGAPAVNPITVGNNRFVSPGYVDASMLDFRLVAPTSPGSVLVDAHSDGYTDIGPYQSNTIYYFSSFLNTKVILSRGDTLAVINGELQPHRMGGAAEFRQIVGQSLRPVYELTVKPNLINNVSTVDIFRRSDVDVPELSADYEVMNISFNGVIFGGFRFSDMPQGNDTIYGSFAPDNIHPHAVVNAVARLTGSGVVLSWDRSPEPDVRAYKILRSNTYPISLDVALEIASLSRDSVLFTDTAMDGSSFYGVVVYDETGNQSDIVTLLTPFSGFAHSQKLTLNTSPSGADILNNVENFPVLVVFDGTNFDFLQTKPDGRDIRFSDRNGKQLPYEIECWDKQRKHGEIWVLVPKVDGASLLNFIKVFWGNPNAISQSNHNAVFQKENGFVIVNHLNFGCHSCVARFPNLGTNDPSQLLIFHIQNISADSFCKFIFSNILCSHAEKRQITTCRSFSISWWSLTISNIWIFYAYVLDNGVLRCYKNGIQIPYNSMRPSPSKRTEEFWVSNVSRSPDFIKLSYENQRLDQRLVQRE